MFRAYAKFALILLVLTSSIATTSIMLGDYVKTDRVFTAFTDRCLVDPCAYHDHRAIVLIDGNRHIEQPVFLPPTGTSFRIASPDGQYLLNFDKVDEKMSLQRYSIRTRTIDDIVVPFGRIEAGWLWLSDNRGLIFAIGNTVYHWNIVDMTLINLFVTDEIFTELILSSGEDFLIARSEGGDVYRVSISIESEPMLLITNTNTDENVFDILLLNYSDTGGLATVVEDDIVIVDTVSGKVLQTFTEFQNVWEVEWSPDGQWLSVISEFYQIHNIHIATSTIYPIEFELESTIDSLHYVGWSPDSRFVVYGNTFSMNWDLGGGLIYIAEPTGDNFREVTNTGMSDSVRWTENSSQLLYLDDCTRSPYDGCSLNIVNVNDDDDDELQPRLLDTNTHRLGQFDEDEIVYLRHNFRYDLYILNVETYETQYLFSPDYYISWYILWEN